MRPAPEPGLQRLEQLTAVRFFAAYAVLLCHYAGVLGLPEQTRFLTNFMGSAVALFFVLSGFVLSYTYERAFSSGRPGVLWSYVAARVARVLPVYWSCLAALLGLYLVFGFGLSLGNQPDYDHKGFSFAMNAFALQAWVPDWLVQQYWNAPGWSISSEFFFYACFPLLLRWRALDGSREIFGALWLAMALALLGYVLAVRLIFGAQAAVWGEGAVLLAYPIRLPLMGMFCFALGIHLARANGRFQAAPVSSTAIAAAAAAVLGVAWLVHWQEGRHGLGLYVGMCAIYLVYTPFFYLLLAWLLRPDVAGALSNRVLILLGNASYALYLLHWLPLTLLVQGPAPFSRSVAWAWVTALSLPPLAIAVYLFFEDPARRAIRRWAGDRLSLAGAGTKSASRLN